MKRIIGLFSFYFFAAFICKASNSTTLDLKEPVRKNAVIIAAPVNNNCAGAISLGSVSTTTTTTGTNVGASADQTSPTCFTYSKNVWYTFIVPAGGGSYNVTVNSGTLVNPDVAVFSGNCGSLTQVGCNSYCGGSGTSTNVSATANCLVAGTYYISVDDDNAACSGTAGTFSLTVTQTISGATVPSNDACASAISLGTISTTTTTTGTNACASADKSSSCHTPTENVWYTFTVPVGGGSYSISIAAGTIVDPCIDVYSGSCASLTEVNCTFGSTSSTSVNANCLTAGTYYINVDDDYGTAGTFSITVTQTISGAAAPTNDNCASAINLGTVSTTTTTTGNNSCATADQGSASCQTYVNNVWYKFTIPAGGGSYSIEVDGGTLTNPAVVLNSGNCGGFIEVVCNSFGTSASVVATGTCLAAGTYYVAVDQSFGTTGTFSVTVTQLASGSGAPANNNCANAINLGTVSTTTTTTGNNFCATADQTSPSCFTYANNVWYKFTIPAGGGSYIASVIGGSISSPAIVINSGGCGGFTELVCNSSFSGSSISASSSCLAAGTYYISVDQDFGSEGTFSVSVTQTAAGTGAPANDNCAGAVSIPIGNCVNGYVDCATQSQVGCVGTASQDVWYKFVATSTTQGISVSASSSFDPVVEVFSGSCASLTSISCNDASYTTGGSNQCANVGPLTVGSTYWIRVYNYGGAPATTTTFTLCLNSNTAYSCNLNYSYTSIATNIEAGVSTVLPGLVDDALSTAVPLGFVFCYDGFMYTQVYIASNNALVFDAVDNCSPNIELTKVPASNLASTGYTILGPIPTIADYTPLNAILGPWHDIDIARGGTVTYATLGVSPNRRFVVYFNAVNQYELSSPCQNAGYAFTGQMKLFETTNNIEIHVQNQKSCTIWNNGQAILGLHNPFGTLAVVPTGYNAVASPGPYNQYSISNLAWQFTTPCTSCLVILPLEIIEFTAKQKDDVSNEIDWVTASENSAKWFHVENSTDGTNFQLIAKIKAANPNGGQYTYIDNLSDKNQTLYYRIATEDINGALSYSGIRVVQRNNKQNISVLKAYPNPFNNEINIDIESIGSNNIKMEIFDIIGKKVYSNSKLLSDGTNFFILDNIDSNAGLLFIKISDDFGNTLFTKKIIKE